MMKDPKKVEVGKRLAEYNHRKREELARAQKSKPKLTSSQCYCAGGTVPIGALVLCLPIQDRRRPVL